MKQETRLVTQKFKLYTDLAEVYDLLYQKIWDYDALTGRVDRVLKQYGVRTVLDLGCGAGHVTEKLQGLGYQVTGADLCKEMLDIARRRTRGISFHEQDMRHLALQDKYDAVVLLGRAFTYMLADEDASQALRSIHSRLKDGGILMFDTFDAEETLRRKAEDRTVYHHEADWGHTKIVRDSTSDIVVSDAGVFFDWTATYKIAEHGQTRTEIDRQRCRCFHRSELEQLLTGAGFENVGFQADGFYFIARKA